MTHAAIQACTLKLEHLMDCYCKTESSRTGWLDHVKVEHVTRGNDHPAPIKAYQTMYVYTGSAYQVCSIVLSFHCYGSTRDVLIPYSLVVQFQQEMFL
jgi:hypothetical protein